MIRGIDFVTVELYGLNQSTMADIEECQVLLDESKILSSFKAEVLNHRRETGYLDVALYPKDGNKRKFIEDIKKYGL
jgi:hypothetical protein|tara:strand:+ start:374 stop:604 length:231 start_codon:yes stop_codon:yes gene_type:complete